MVTPKNNMCYFTKHMKVFPTKYLFPRADIDTYELQMYVLMVLWLTYFLKVLT